MDHPAFSTVVARLAEVCRLAAPRSMLAELRQEFRHNGLARAVVQHDTAALFDWLIRPLSLQGVSDKIAWAYMDQHGSVTHVEVAQALGSGPACCKLRSHWQFAECGFTKGAFTCAKPAHIVDCPLPRHDLRNGRLNQTAYSLALFLRDVCDGDLVGWIDLRLAEADQPDVPDRLAAMRGALLEPLSCVYGVSYKVLSMALADLLLAGDPERERWVATGASMVAIDTLVHNWLHRTGSLLALGAEHVYGLGCYAPGGCASIIEAASLSIDARAFCPEGPATFPRLVQKAVWLFCAEDGWNICNGNRIDDRYACTQQHCPLTGCCDRIPLRMGRPGPAALKAADLPATK